MAWKLMKTHTREGPRPGGRLLHALMRSADAVLLRAELWAQLTRLEKGGSLQTAVLCEGKQTDL